MSADMASDAELEVRMVSHHYRRHEALHKVSFKLRPGLTGLLGPNGAGKSTLLEVVATALRPGSGEVVVAGQIIDCGRIRASARRKIGFLPQRFDLMERSTCLQNVQYAAWAQGTPTASSESAARSALASVGLKEQSHRRAGNLSGGQRQRLGIACALAHDPEILILDEPTVGLDPAQRADIRMHLDTLSADRHVLISTHIVEDLTRIADWVMVLNEGRLVFDGSLHELTGLALPEADELHRLESAYVRLVTELRPREQ